MHLHIIYVYIEKKIGRQRYLNSRPKDQKVDDKTTTLRGYLKIDGTLFQLDDSI